MLLSVFGLLLIFFVGTGTSNPVISSGAKLVDTQIPTDPINNCPRGYTQPANAGFANCYKIFTTSLDFRSAAAQCAAHNGTLASVQNGFENAYLFTMADDVNVDSVWLGMECTGDKSTCVTNDGTPFVYSNFYPGQPNVNGSCVYLSLVGKNNQKWMSDDCEQKLAFACEVASLGKDTNITPSPTPHLNCDPSVPVVDLVIAFDSSDIPSQWAYEQMVEKFRSLVYNVQLDANHTRIMLGTYNNKQHFDDTDLNRITDDITYMNRLNLLQNNGYQEQFGNNIDAVLKYMLSGTNKQTPFRENARKILVFISSVGWNRGGVTNNGFPDPTTDINMLKQMGAEFIPIAFANGAIISQLSQFSSKCLQIAPEYDDVASAVNFIASNICYRTSQC